MYASSTGRNLSTKVSVDVLYDHFERIPDSAEKLQPILREIAAKNSQPLLWRTQFEPRVDVQRGWPA